MAAQCNFTIPKKQCTLETCCLEQGSLSYRPTLAGNAIYAGFFGVILLAQLIFLIRYPKTYGFFIGMCCGLLLEIGGYIGRILIYENPFDINNFIIYLVCLTIAPAFLMAAIYVCMGRVIVAFGAGNSIVKPRTYTLICVSGDLISLVLQSLGGALAATAAKSTTGTKSQLGVHIMVAGLIFQLFATSVFAVISGVFAFNLNRRKAGRNPAFIKLTKSLRFKLFLGALLFATVAIFIRSVFRVAELYGGFDSDIAQNETEFMIFEGPMIIAATIALTIFHPGSSFMGMWEDANWTFGGKNEAGFAKVEQKELAHFTRLSTESEETVMLPRGQPHVPAPRYQPGV